MNRFIAAMRFLTILPIPGKWGCAERDLAASAVMFPMVGLVVGAIVSLVALGLWQIFPPLPAAVLITLVLIGASGGFHLDGLSDAADGLLSSRPKEQILEIMKDSRIGAMGTIAIVGIFVLKTSALVSLAADGAWRAVLIMALTGRCLMAIALMVLPYARPEGGLGKLFSKDHAFLTCLFALLVMSGAGFIADRWAGLIAVGVATVVVAFFALWCWRRIGGMTGDTLGASCEIAEAAVALAFIAEPMAHIR